MDGKVFYTSYVESDAGACPICGAEDIRAGRFTNEGTKAYRRVDCGRCASHWMETFSLISIDDIVVSKK